MLLNSKRELLKHFAIFDFLQDINELVEFNGAINELGYNLTNYERMKLSKFLEIVNNIKGVK